MEEVKQKILSLTKKKMQESGEYNREAYREFIEESLEYYLEKGELTEEDDLDAIQEELMEAYNEIEEEESAGLDFGESEEKDAESKDEEETDELEKEE